VFQFEGGTMTNINDFENEVLLAFSKYSDYSIVDIRKAFVLCNKSFDLLRRCLNESIFQDKNLVDYAKEFNESFFDNQEKKN